MGSAAEQGTRRPVQPRLWRPPRNLDTYTTFRNACATRDFLRDDRRLQPSRGHNLPRYRGLDLFGYLPERARRPKSRPATSHLSGPRHPMLSPTLRPCYDAGSVYYPVVTEHGRPDLGWLYSDGRPDCRSRTPVLTVSGRYRSHSVKYRPDCTSVERFVKSQVPHHTRVPAPVRHC